MFAYIEASHGRPQNNLNSFGSLKAQLKMTIMIYVRSEACAEISSSVRRHFQPCQQHCCDPFSLPTI